MLVKVYRFQGYNFIILPGSHSKLREFLPTLLHCYWSKVRVPDTSKGQTRNLGVWSKERFIDGEDANWEDGHPGGFSNPCSQSTDFYFCNTQVTRGIPLMISMSICKTEQEPEPEAMAMLQLGAGGAEAEHCTQHTADSSVNVHQVPSTVPRPLTVQYCD